MRWILPFLFLTNTMSAQMTVGSDTLYGNEWMDYNKTYLKIKIANEGIFQLTYSYLLESGLPVDQIPGSQYQLWHMGVEQPLFTSSDDVFQTDDFILFYGKPNESELDVFLFENGMDEMLNPGYSLVSDTAAYFLTWTQGPVKRYNLTENMTGLPVEPEPYYMHNLVQRVTNNFVKRPNGVGAMSRFSLGEGFAGVGTIDLNVDFNTSALFPAGPSAILEVRMSANNSRDHDLLYTFNGNELERHSFQNYRFLSHAYEISASDLQASNRFRYERMGAAENRYFPAYFSLTYPATFEWNNFGFRKFDVTGIGEKKIIWENYNHPDVWLFDLTGQRLIRTSGQTSLELGFMQSAQSTYAQCASSAFITPAIGQIREFEQLEQIPGNYIMLYHPDIRLNNQGTDILQEYIDYRNSTGFEVMPVNVLELYDQFAYGVDRHFIALRNFAHYMHHKRETIDHLFIVGKGREFRNLRTDNQVNSASGSFFIPTYGVPGADQLIVCGNHEVDPIMGIGRLPVQNGDDLALYLEKVRAYEAVQQYPVAEVDRRWMKRVMHLSGGTGEAEREQLRQILMRMGRKLEQGKLQVNLIPFAKLSSEPIEENVPSLIYDRINDGVSLISFLGHSGSTTIDFNIENFSRYNNRDKNFHFLALGCSVGNIHLPGITLGERFVFLKDNGSISFMASSGLGYPSILENYGNIIYERLDEERGLTLGQLFRDVHHHFRSTSNRFFQEQLEQMTTNGDPGLRYNYPEGPDVTFDYPTITIKEGNLNVSADSFTLELEVLSLGTRPEDSIRVQLIRQYPDGTQDSMVVKYDQEKYRQPVSITLPVGGEKSAGQNRIYAELNYNRAIAELPDPEALDNNVLRAPDGSEGYPFYVFGVSASPVWPPDLAVIQEVLPELKAVTGNLFAAPETYLLELDTTDQFNSPFKMEHSLQSGGGVIRWTPDMALTDNRTYYWRISGDSLSPEAGYNWEEASFSIAAAERPGLSMRHPAQFSPIENLTLRQDTTHGWIFGQANRTLEIKNQVFVNNSSPSGSIEGFQFGSMFPWNVLHQGLLVQVIDPLTGVSWRNPPGGLYGSLNTTPSTNMFAFPYNVQEVDQRRSLIHFLNDTIPDGHLIFVYSIQRTQQSSFVPEDWEADSLELGGKNLFNILEAQGASGIRQLKEKGSVPFIIGYVKGSEVFEEQYAEQITDVVDLIHVYLERLPEGQVEWQVPIVFSGINRAFWQIRDSRFPEQDSIIVGFNAQWPGGDQVQETAINIAEGDFTWTYSGPPENIQFSWKAYNESRYAPQLSNWTVTGDWLPDLTFYRETATAVVDTVQQGEAYRPMLQIENLSVSLADSTGLTYRIRMQNAIVQEGIIPISSLPGSSKQTVTLDIPTEELSGLCFLELQINADGQVRELRLDNNFGVLAFYVEEDRINPLVDVYFDGIDIMDGDLISARPEIRIILRDENPWFLLNDTALFSLRLQYPSGTWRNLYFSEGGMTFLPAVEGDKENKAEILWQGEFTEDGDYLLEVSARDASGNVSGQQPYRKRFKVINRQLISNIVNFPNPFSTATRFVYTLTGATSPDYFKIQIFTLSGQLVREISHLELGPLRVGTHTTDFVWNGTDQYGQLLANGVYMYRLQTQNTNEEAVEHYETRLDRFTTNGWSKMVILR